jgi:hypothetical protein
MIAQLLGGFVGGLLVRVSTLYNLFDLFIQLILTDKDYYSVAVLGGATIVPDPTYEDWWQVCVF